MIRLFVILELCDTEIEYLYGVPAALIWFEPDIVGLEVAVDDALLVCLLNGGTNLFENVERPGDRQISLLVENLAESAAVKILHHQVCDLPFVRVRKTKIGDVDHIRVTQAPGGPGLAAKALYKLRPPHILRRDDLDRDRPFGSQMCRQVHGPHTAATQLAFDVVFAVDGLANKIQVIHTCASKNSNRVNDLIASNYAAEFI